jgi:hypothetical protein
MAASIERIRNLSIHGRADLDKLAYALRAKGLTDRAIASGSS